MFSEEDKDAQPMPIYLIDFGVFCGSRGQRVIIGLGQHGMDVYGVCDAHNQEVHLSGYPQPEGI